MSPHVAAGLDEQFSVHALLQPEQRSGLQRDARRVPTKMDPLDRMLSGGFRLGDLVLLGGCPGIGKTIVGLQWARAFAQSGTTAVVASYEHDEQTLMGRLLALEIGMLDLGPVDSEVEAVVAGLLNGEWAGDLPVASHPLVRAAMSRIETYADQLVLLPASRLRLGLGQLEDLVTDLCAESKALVIDYVQKVPVAGRSSSWEERGARDVAARLKQLALSSSSVVVAIAAVDEAGLSARRARMSHLRAAASLSYEADVAVMMNEKLNATSRVHTAYDLTKIQEFEESVVFSVEKNRSGRSTVDLEFKKDFQRFRFEPTGGFVAETLVDGVTVDN